METFDNVHRSAPWSRREAAVSCRNLVGLAVALLLVGLPAAAVAQSSQTQAEPDTVTGTLHIVQKGDTLWDLAAEYLSNPRAWPSVHEINRRIIANPHLIYPGQRVWIPIGGGTPVVLSFEEVWPGPETERSEMTRRAGQLVFSTASDTTRTGAETARTAAGQTETPPTETPPVVEPPETEVTESGVRFTGFVEAEPEYYPLVSESAVLAAGYIGEPADWPDGKLFGGENPNLNMSLYNQVFLDVGDDQAQIGDLYLVVERGRRIRHPEWGHYLGRKVGVKGIIQIVDVASNTSQGELVAVFDSVRRKDRVIPAPTVDSRPWKEFIPVQGGRTGYVIAREEAEGNLHPYDMLFIDGGTEEGVQVGDLYSIRRSQAERGRLRFFEDELGKAVVIAVREQTATVMILNLTTSDINVGERIELVGRSVFAGPMGRDRP